MDDADLAMVARPAYYQIFDVNPADYMNPDEMISSEYGGVVVEVHAWGRSVGHSRMVRQTTRAERDAIQEFTGHRVPATPAQAAGGKANLGGYRPYQPGNDRKGKGKGRSAPYPQAASS